MQRKILPNCQFSAKSPVISAAYGDNKAVVQKFICFEGGEGAGKSTQMDKLAGYLEQRGDKVVTTREPGGSANAENIRDLLLQENTNWSPLSELYLLLAARHDHVENFILPNLQAGAWVLCDRFYFSTVAYQGYGGGLDVALIELLSQPIMTKAIPQAVILLDIAPEEGLQRVASRRGGKTRFDNMDLDYHRRVRQGFLDLATADSSPPTYVIAADSDEEEVFENILLALKEME